MCSSQIALMAAERLTASGLGRDRGIARFVGLAHTEGCGFGGESLYRLLHRAYRGYATHPNVASALLLEHGCEKISNDAMRRQFEAAGLPLDRFGWASVQLDGGIEKSLSGVESWFASAIAALPPAEPVPAGLGALAVGIAAAGPVSTASAEALASLARAILGAGGSVMIPESDPLMAGPFRAGVFAGEPRPSLAYGEPAAERGLHLVATETEDWVENLTGIGASGAHLFVGVASGQARPGHPLVPLIQVAEPAERARIPAEDLDGFLSGDPAADAAMLAALCAAVASGTRTVRSMSGGPADFQLTRGLLGVST
jgi:altronate dehydratase